MGADQHPGSPPPSDGTLHPPGNGVPADSELPVIDFQSLAHGGKEVLIEFHSQRYRLRVTKNGKLILNK